jgi:hypothetical protein
LACAVIKTRVAAVRFSYDDRVTTSPVRPVVLRNGAGIEDPLRVVLGFLKARFENEATLEGFDFNASPKLPAAQIRDLAALRWLAGGESVIA